ncbi:unnamed protein product [Coregonus sp. 'balchen']|nr:unnamed protein product [Coregonus sp. 'balchen']
MEEEVKEEEPDAQLKEEKKTTKVHLAKMCRKIAKTVSHIAVEILIPTLAQILELDAAKEASSSPSLTGSLCANNASIQEHVVKFNEQGLPKWPGSGKSLCSQRVKTPYSSATDFEQSHMTLLQRAHGGEARLTDPLNALFGITENTILQALGDQSCSSGSPGLTRSVVREVVSQVNSDISLIISCSSSGKSSPVLCDTGRRYAMQAAQKLVSVICAKLRRFGFTGQAAPQAKTNPSKENVDIEASLASLTGEVMAVMVNSGECQEGEQGTMDALREIAHKVQFLASRDSVCGLLEDSLEEKISLKETVSSGSMASQNMLIFSPSEKMLRSPVMSTIEKLSCVELKSEATKAISEVLIRSSRSLSAQMSACTPEPSSNLASERNLPAMPEEHLTSTINIGSEASEIMDSFLSDMKCIAQSDFTKLEALPVALNLAKKLQNMLRGLYSRLLAPKSSDRDKEENLEQAKNISAPTLIQRSFGSNKSEPMLPGVISPGAVALCRGQSESSRPMMALSPQIIQLHLDSTTKEVMSTIVSCFKPEVPEEELTYSDEKMSSDTSLLATEFVDHIIAWLKDISAASSATSSSESLCVSPNAVLCKLTSETFQTQAAKRVKQVLSKSVRCFSNLGSSSRSESHTSWVSQSDFGILQDSSSTSSMSFDSSAFGVVATVVKDMKSLLQTTESTDSLEPTDSALLHGTSSYSETSSKSWQSGVPISDFKLWSTAQTIYRHLRNNLREFFTRHHQPDVKTTDATMAQAKKSISQILVAIQEDMSRSEELMTSGELVQLHDIVGTMLEGVETVCSEGDKEQEWQELQRPSSSLSTASKGSRSQRLDNTHTLPGTPMSTELLDNSFPVVRSTCIDARDDIGASLSDLRKTLNGVVSFIIENLDPEVLQQTTSPDSDLTRLEELISKEKIHSLCHDLVDQLESLIWEQNSIPLINSVAVAKCVSDTVLLNLARRENQVGKPFSSKLIYMFAEESVKRLLLPLIFPPSSWGLDQEASLHDVPSRASSRRSSSSTTSGVTVLDGCSSLVSGSSSQIYDDTVNLFTRAICYQVMNNMSGASSHTMEDNIHDRDASVIAIGSVEQAQSYSSYPQAVNQGIRRFRFLPKISKFRINLKVHQKWV